MTLTFWRELQAILDQGFTGQLVLHCNEGTVVKYEKRETLRPSEVANHGTSLKRVSNGGDGA